MKKTILVTGGTGYIGSHACVELLESGYHVIIVDNLSNSQKDVLNRIEKITQQTILFFETDIRDKKGLQVIFSTHKIDAVIHFAGLKAVGESCEQPLKYYQNNVYGTLVLTEVMEAFGVKNIVFSSSATVYGDSDQVPYSEHLPVQATNPYGQTKAMVEQILRDYSTAEQFLTNDTPWKIVLLRYFNPTGAHESGLIGELPNGIPNNLVPYVSQVATGKLEQLSVFGGDYPTKDGTGVRDYIHVVDLAKGHVKALEILEADPLVQGGCKTYNLGTGVGYSVLDIIQAFEKASDKKIPYKIVPRRSGDIATCVANTALAKKELNWETEKGLEQMMVDTWRWQNSTTMI
jgi:UDP-glucose 4-epimerase